MPYRPYDRRAGHHRRTEWRGLPWWQRPSPDSPGNLRTAILAAAGSSFLSLFVTAICEYLTLRGIISVGAAWIVLAFAWAIGVIGIVLSEIVWGQKLRYRACIGITAAVLLGGSLWAFDLLVSAVSGQSALARSAVTADQVAEMERLAALIGSKDELQLRDDFDFPTLEQLNILIERNALENCQPKPTITCVQQQAFVPPGGDLYVDTLIGHNQISRKGGAFQLRLNLKTIPAIVRTKKGYDAYHRMKAFEDSVLLPSNVLIAVRDFNVTVKDNTDNLIRVLNLALLDSPDNFTHAYDPASPHYQVINNLYVRSFAPLKPKADAVLSSIRTAMRVDSGAE